MFYLCLVINKGQIMKTQAEDGEKLCSGVYNI